MAEQQIFTSIENKQRLVDRVANQITQLIMENTLEPGTRLPSEMKMAGTIGVSRTVVREAIQILIARGLVETQHGVGTTVRRIDNNQVSAHLGMLMRLNGLTLDHLHQVRSILEVEIAGIAAAQASNVEIVRLEQHLTMMEGLETDPLGYAGADGEFHRCLAQLAHNPLLVLLLDSISDLMREVRLAVSESPGLYAQSMEDHRRIVAEIRARSAQGAWQAMSDHLEHAREFQHLLEDDRS